MKPTGESGGDAYGGYNEEANMKNDNYGGEEEIKGADFDKMALEKPFIPSLIEDGNFDFSVWKPRLQGSKIVYLVKGVDR